mmetsp:Transcript_40384/g.97496  ORF Transcript_40384/g.97496 Transcript_40384/m.97496 type:complete len:86 (+) Transcript_40384:220-477(+)
MPNWSRDWQWWLDSSAAISTCKRSIDKQWADGMSRAAAQCYLNLPMDFKDLYWARKLMAVMDKQPPNKRTPPMLNKLGLRTSRHN